MIEESLKLKKCVEEKNGQGRCFFSFLKSKILKHVCMQPRVIYYREKQLMKWENEETIASIASMLKK